MKARKAPLFVHVKTLRQNPTDRVLVHLDTKFEKTIGSESFYVAISRARHEARLYVDDRSKLTLAVGRSQQKPYGLEASESVTPVVAGKKERSEKRGQSKSESMRDSADGR